MLVWNHSDIKTFILVITLLTAKKESAYKHENIVLKTSMSVFMPWHLVDDSGRWGRGGLFTALENRSDAPCKQYELAGKMKGELTSSRVTNSFSLKNINVGLPGGAVVKGCATRGSGFNLRLSRARTGVVAMRQDSSY